MVGSDFAVSRPLSWEGTYNARDLGGYPALGGRKTKDGVFLRTDGLQALTAAGKQALLEYGVACVIDLRTDEEVRQAPDAVTAADGVDWYHVPLADGVASNNFRSLPEHMGEMYVGLLEYSGGKFAEIFRIIGSHPKGAVLFHCSAGKDRTGVTAMLLLSLAGVERSVILADYAVSYGNLVPLFQAQKAKMKEFGIEIPEHVMRSDPEEMELAMDWLEQHYGPQDGADHVLRNKAAAEQYLLHLGIGPAALEELENRMLE